MSDTRVDTLLALSAGLIVRSEHPHQARTLRRAVASGALVAVVPGIVTTPEAACDWRLRALAVARRWPDAVLCGDAAIALAGGFGPTPDVVEVAAPTALRCSYPGLIFTRRTVPARWRCTRASVTCTHPALTCIDRADRDNGALIDDMLRRRVVTLAQLEAALRDADHRAGNAQRRRVVWASRDLPWSQAERQFHELLRRAGVKGWVANHAVLIDGRRYYLDVAFPAQRVVIEVDGYEAHAGHEAFELDRERQNALVLAGWRVLRFTWRMLTDEPEEVVSAVRAALRRDGFAVHGRSAAPVKPTCAIRGAGAQLALQNGQGG